MVYLFGAVYFTRIPNGIEMFEFDYINNGFIPYVYKDLMIKALNKAKNLNVKYLMFLMKNKNIL